ncbi:MAG: helix-turn-helix transcriptional regulator [Acidiferrobacterales bacterium]
MQLPETGFLRLPQVPEIFPVSRSAWWLGVRQGRYPQAVKLGTRTTAWRVEDIRRLCESTASRAA